MRNQIRPNVSSGERSKITRHHNESSSSSSSSSPPSKGLAGLTKILKKGKQHSEMQKRFKEKLRDKLCERGEQPSIVTDVSSQKSYIDLTNPVAHHAAALEQYSRISVIRTALSSKSTSIVAGCSDAAPVAPSTDDGYGAADMAMGFYQEKPMDYSPKNKYHHNVATMPSNNFELSRNYAMVA